MRYKVVDYQTHLRDIGIYRGIAGCDNRFCVSKVVGTYRFRWVASIVYAMVILQDMADHEPYPISHEPKIEAA